MYNKNRLISICMIIPSIVIIIICVWQYSYFENKNNNTLRTHEIIFNRTITNYEIYKKNCYEFNTESDLLCSNIESNITNYFNPNITYNCDNGYICLNKTIIPTNIATFCLNHQSCDIIFGYSYNVLYLIGFKIENTFDIIETKEYDYVCDFDTFDNCMTNSTTDIELNDVFYEKNNPKKYYYNDNYYEIIIQIIIASMIIAIIFFLIGAICFIINKSDNEDNYYEEQLIRQEYGDI